MARNLRTSHLSLKLDVIVEEHDGPDRNDDFLNNEHTSIDRGVRNSTSCTVTLKNAEQSSGNEPQFLHMGKWPTVAMVDGLLNSISETLSSGRSLNKGAVSLPLPKSSAEIPSKDGVAESTWKLIRPDQLSMLMDYWNPDKGTYPLNSAIPSTECLSQRQQNDPVHTAQQSLFLQEVKAEYATRMQTVEHMEDLEDNDSAIEIVAILEGYRQNGWAEEMIEAFPRECWLFWLRSGIEKMKQAVEEHVCDKGHFVISGA